jgi:L-threonylcarbamoyladenylate synthase
MPSPGLLAKHYSPRAALTLYEGDARSVAARMAEDARTQIARGYSVGIVAADEDPFEGAHVARLGSERDLASVAARLYSALRELDAAGVDVILARGFPALSGIGVAIADRLRRAADGRIVSC